MKIRAVAVELFKQKDGGTYVTKLMVAFYSFWLHPVTYMISATYRTVNTLQEKFDFMLCSKVMAACPEMHTENKSTYDCSKVTNGRNCLFCVFISFFYPTCFGLS